jgi:hypothetical protein
VPADTGILQVGEQEYQVESLCVCWHISYHGMCQLIQVLCDRADVLADRVKKETLHISRTSIVNFIEDKTATFCY